MKFKRKPRGDPKIQAIVIAEEPVINLYAEATSKEVANSLIQKHAEKFMPSQPNLEKGATSAK